VYTGLSHSALKFKKTEYVRIEMWKTGEVLKLLGIWRVHPLHANQQRALASPSKRSTPMATRLLASQRTREELMALIEGRLSTVSAKDELVKLATRLIVEEAVEGEAGDAVGRDYYEHGAQRRPGLP
jgi:hypothetical protein